MIRLPALALASGLVLTGGSAWAQTAAWTMPTTTPAAAPEPAAPEPAAPEPVAPEPARQPAPDPRFAGYVAAPTVPRYYRQPMAQPARPEAPQEAAPAEPMVAFDAQAGTIFPLGIGPELTLELPGRILIQGDLLWMPGAYAAAIGGVAQAAAGGATGAALGQLVQSTLSNSLVVRAGAGWRPFSGHGFELGVGYTGIKISGSVTPQVIGDLIGGDMGAQVPQLLHDNVQVQSMLHNVHVTAGWRWVPVPHLAIRAFLGYAQTLGSSTSIAIPGHADVQSQIEPTVDQTVNSAAKSYVKLPLIGATLGYRF